MQSLLTICRRHFDHVHPIPAATITLAPLVRKLCEQNRCGHYGKNWTCPPAVPPIEYFREKIAGFDTFVLVSHIYEVKSSFDWRAMLAGGADFNDRLRAVKRALETERPGQAFFVLGAGACPLCDPCACVAGEACRNPAEAIVSMEAAGIDVMRLMKDNGLTYYHGKNTVTFIGGVFCHADGGAP
jgi:predicted metal-binding protein